MTQRIHAVIEPDFDSDPKRKARLRELILAKFNIANLNEGRFRNLGVVSGDVDPNVIDEIKLVKGLKSVSIDEAVYIR